MYLHNFMYFSHDLCSSIAADAVYYDLCNKSVCVHLSVGEKKDKAFNILGMS